MINQALFESDELALTAYLDQLPRPPTSPEKPTVLLSLRDHLNMKLGDIYLKKGNLAAELEHRRAALLGTRPATAYLQLAHRLDELNQKSESEATLAECVRLYPSCLIWFTRPEDKAESTTLK